MIETKTYDKKRTIKKNDTGPRDADNYQKMDG